MRNGYRISQQLVREAGYKTRPKENKKTEFIAHVRSKAIEPSWAAWLEVVSVPKTTIDEKGRVKHEYAYPALIGGTGGIIENKDMGVCFAEALNLLFDLQTGEAKENAKLLLKSSLLGISIEDSIVEGTLFIVIPNRKRMK